MSTGVSHQDVRRNSTAELRFRKVHYRGGVFVRRVTLVAEMVPQMVEYNKSRPTLAFLTPLEKHHSSIAATRELLAFSRLGTVHG